MTNVAQQTASNKSAVRPGPSQFNTDRSYPG
jgi:hypothetical protein